MNPPSSPQLENQASSSPIRSTPTHTTKDASPCVRDPSLPAWTTWQANSHPAPKPAHVFTKLIGSQLSISASSNAVSRTVIPLFLGPPTTNRRFSHAADRWRTPPHRPTNKHLFMHPRTGTYFGLLSLSCLCLSHKGELKQFKVEISSDWFDPACSGLMSGAATGGLKLS